MKRLASTLLACTASTLLWAQDVQWASRVIEFSSELTSFEYSASQVLGKPNVLPRPGDSPNAWLAREPDEIDFVKVGFDQPMKIRQIAIAESYNPSSLYRVYIYDQNDKEELLNTFIPKPIGLKGRMLNIYLSETAYPVAAIKIVLNGKLVPGYSGIDAIGISSSIEPIEAKIAIADNVRDSIPTIELAKTINSTYQESRPLIAPDGKTLFFSRRFHPDNIGGVYDAEDIWYSEYDEATGEWQESKNIGAPLNNANSNFISSITPDGNSMVVILGNEYRKGDKMKPGISISTKTEEGWTKPENVEIERAFIENLDANYFLSNDRKYW
ncbi:MAG: hypothetical protein HC842_07645 [Cytophagales bacterium]|nr:hypothetical protein [Cytophagales bacterium]